MVKQIYHCPAVGCLEFFPSKSLANKHLKLSCAIHKKLSCFRKNGSPLYRKPQRVDIEMMTENFCLDSIGKGSYGQVFPAKIGNMDLIAKYI